MPKVAECSRNVVLLDASRSVTLAVVQSLRDAGGYNVTAVSRHLNSAVRFSRHSRFVFLPEWSWDAGPEQLERLLPASEAILFPVSVDAAKWILSHQDVLAQNWKLAPLPAMAALTTAADKALTGELAESLGCRFPAFCLAEVWKPGCKIHFPALLKPRAGLGGGEIVYFETEQEFLAYRKSHTVRGRVLQTFVPGTPSSLGMLVVSGIVEASVSYQCVTRRGKYGPFISSTLIDEELLLPTGHLVARALCWHGLLNLDFVTDRTGMPWLLEANPRPWGNLLAANNWGVNFCHLACQLAANQKFDPPSPQGQYYFGPRDCLPLVRKGEIEFHPRVRLFWDETPFRYFIRDPLPFMHNWARQLAR